MRHLEFLKKATSGFATEMFSVCQRTLLLTAMGQNKTKLQFTVHNYLCKKSLKLYFNLLTFQKSFPKILQQTANRKANLNLKQRVECLLPKEKGGCWPDCYTTAFFNTSSHDDFGEQVSLFLIVVS